MEPADRDIAMVFQNYALYPHMTVYDNMAYGLRNRGVPRAEIEQRVAEAAKLLGIGGFLKRKPRELSGGQRQRVAMGRAIVREPQAFLFDEPLSNLDAKLRVQMRIEIRRLHNRLKATSIFVTHDQVEAMTLADTVVVMNQGRVEQMGAPTEVYRLPATQFVATFIGSPAMNLLPGRVVGAGEVETSGGAHRLRPGVLFDVTRRPAGRGRHPAGGPAARGRRRRRADVRQGLCRGAGRHATGARHVGFRAARGGGRRSGADGRESLAAAPGPCICSIPPAGKACAVTFAAHRPDVGLTDAPEARTVAETARGGVIRLPDAAVCIPST